MRETHDEIYFLAFMDFFFRGNCLAFFFWEEREWVGLISLGIGIE
jgi:hypothetical protein